MDNRNTEILDLAFIIILIAITLFLGKFVINTFGYSFWCFNSATCGTLLLGELIWWLVKKRFFEK